jgi:hypothetical protein
MGLSEDSIELSSHLSYTFLTEIAGIGAAEKSMEFRHNFVG